MKKVRESLRKLSKKQLVVISVALVTILLLLVPFFLPNGTERFSGTRKLAAQAALDAASRSHSGINFVLGSFKVYVDDVQPDDPSKVTAETLCNNAFTSELEANQPDRFAVTLSFRGLVNNVIEQETLHICREDVDSF